MESLLRWGIENSATSAGDEPQPPPRDISKLDPAIIDQILGKSEAVQMKEALAVAMDEATEEGARLVALDDFEMLIESIDNANNITSMKMWQPLIELLSSPSDAIRMNALWILGTAVQNNPKAQEAFLSHQPLSKIVYLVGANLIDHTPQTRAKALYCLSGALRHNRSAVESLESFDGWAMLQASLSDPEITVRRKVAFLFNSLLLPDGSTATEVLPTTTSDITRDAIVKHGISHDLVDVLINKEKGGDEDLVEKSARAVLSFLEAGGSLLQADSKMLSSLLQEDRASTKWGLAAEERTTLERLLSSAR